MIVGSSKGVRASVVVPTYNRAHLIGESLDSLLDQTSDGFEVIVVDDGSMDETRRFVDEHPLAVRYVRTDHAGPAEARNVGMRMALGDYIAYLDSDDLYYPFKIGLQMDWLDDHPDHVMVYSDFSAFDPDSGSWDDRHLRTYHESAYRSASYNDLFTHVTRLSAERAFRKLDATSRKRWSDTVAYSGHIYRQYLANTVVFTNSMMFRRRLLPRIGLQSKGFGHFHDLEFALRICGTGIVTFLDLPTYALRYHSGQISTTRNPGGNKVAIKKQQDLLRVARTHLAHPVSDAPSDAGRILARLCRAVAVPMIAHTPTSAHERRAFPSRARAYLQAARQYGHAAPHLYALSYCPEIIKRAYFKLESGLRGLRVMFRASL